MTAGLETFAKVRALHDQSGHPATGTQAPNCQSAAVQSGQVKGATETVYPLRRTTADKRRDVQALLGTALSDREIARRAGVSPTTVGAVRRGAQGPMR